MAMAGIVGRAPAAPYPAPPPARAASVLELGDAQLQLGDPLPGRDTELARDPRGRVPGRVAEALSLAAPAVEHVAERAAYFTALDAETLGELLREVVRALEHERERADPRQAETLEGPRLLPGSAMRPRGAALAATFALRRDRHRGSRRSRDARLRGLLDLFLAGSPCAATSSASSASVPPTEARPASPEVVAAAGELGLALPEHADERRGEEDRRVRAEPDPDEEREREVLERVAAEEEAERPIGSIVMNVVARDRGAPPTARRSR